MFRLTVVILIACVAGCSSNPTSPSSTGSGGAARITTVEISPRGVEGGDGATGIVRLAAAAPATGVVVSMTSSDDVASVPPTVTIPAGESFARFAVTSRRVADDRVATITATTAGSRASLTFEVWAINAPVYFKVFGDLGNSILDGDVRRFVPGNSTIVAECEGNEVRMSFAKGGETWTARFKAPGNEPIGTRSIEVVRPAPKDLEDAVGLLEIAGRGRSCNTKTFGRFSVNEIDLQNNRVNVFDASFVQYCDDRPEALYGDLRLVNVAPGSSSSCVQ